MGPPYTRGPQLPQDSVQSLLYRTANTSTGLELVQRKTPEGPFVVSSLWVAPSAARSVAPPPPRGCATQVQIAPSRCQLLGGEMVGRAVVGRGYPPCVASHPLLQVPCVEASVGTEVMLAPQLSPYLTGSPSDPWEMALGPPAARRSTALSSGKTLGQGWPVSPLFSLLPWGPGC